MAASDVDAVARMLMNGLPATGSAEISTSSGIFPRAFSARWAELLFRNCT